jgi:hypothetical protein
MDATRRVLKNEACRQGIPELGGPLRVCRTISIPLDLPSDHSTASSILFMETSRSRSNDF